MKKSQTEAFHGSSPSLRGRWLGKSLKLGLFQRLTQIETSVKEEASKVSHLVEKATEQQERCCEHHKEAMGRLQDSVDGLPTSQELMSGTTLLLVGRALGPVVSVVILCVGYLAGKGGQGPVIDHEASWGFVGWRLGPVLSGTKSAMIVFLCGQKRCLYRQSDSNRYELLPDFLKTVGFVIAKHLPSNAC